MIATEQAPQVLLDYSNAGRFLTDSEWIHPTRRIDTYEVLFVTHGKVYLQEDGTEYVLSAGDLILLRPGVEHGGTRTSHGRTSFLWGHFSAAELSALGLTPGLHRPDEPDRLASAFRCLLHIDNTPGYPPYARSAAMTLLLAEIAASQARAASDASRLAHEISEWVRIHSDRKLTVQQVSDQFSYHPDYLSLVTRRSFGFSLKQLISTHRLRHVKNLLLTTDLSIKQLAAQLDFGNEGRLIHFFKYHEGISPARYRNQYVNTHLNCK